MNEQLQSDEARKTLKAFYHRHEIDFSEKHFLDCIDKTFTGIAFSDMGKAVDAQFLKEKLTGARNGIKALMEDAPWAVSYADDQLMRLWPVPEWSDRNELLASQSRDTAYIQPGGRVVHLGELLERSLEAINATLEDKSYKRRGRGENAHEGSFRLIRMCRYFVESLITGRRKQLDKNSAMFRDFVAVMHEILLPNHSIKDYRKRINKALQRGGI